MVELHLGFRQHAPTVIGVAGRIGRVHLLNQFLDLLLVEGFRAKDLAGSGAAGAGASTLGPWPAAPGPLWVPWRLARDTRSEPAPARRTQTIDIE